MEISKYRQMYAWLTRPGYNKGGRINFANGSAAKKIDAYTQAKTDFKGKVWDTVEEAVESNKKIMKKWNPQVVKETMVEKRLRKFGKIDKKPYIPAEKLEATIVEEFQKKFPDKKIKLSVKDATYSDGRRRVDSPEFKKFKEEFVSNRFVKGEEDILKAYASARKRLGFVKKGQGPGHWQVLEELKKKGKGGVASRIKEILKANNLPTRPLPGNLKQVIKNSFNELVDAGTEIVDSKAVYDNLPAEFKGTKTSQPDIYKKRTQGELGLKSYIRSILKDEKGFFETTRRNTPEAIAKRTASVRALGKGKGPTEYQLSKRAFRKYLDPLNIKEDLRSLRPEKAAQLHHGLAKAYGEDAANLLFTSEVLNDYDDAERSLFRLASQKDKLVREQPPGFEKRIKQIEAIENRIVKGKSIEGIKLPAVKNAPGGQPGPGPQNVKRPFTVNKGHAKDIVQDIKGAPGEEITKGRKTDYRKGRKGLLGYRKVDLEKVKDIDPAKKVVLGEGKMKGIDRSKTVAGLDKDPIFEKSFMDFDNKDSLNLAKKMKAQGFKCTVTKANGGPASCNNPRAYLDDIAKQREIARTGSGKQAINAARKLKGLKTFMTSTLGPVAIAGEIAFAVPFALSDYASGESTSRIINNASFGLFGDSVRDEIVKYGGEEAGLIFDARERGKKLDRIEEQGEMFMGPDDSMLYPDQLKGATQRFEKSIEPFMKTDLSLPPGIGLRYFDREMADQAFNKLKNAQMNIMKDKRMKQEQRRVEPEEDYYGFMGARGGIANVRRPGAIPPDSGPMPQGLESLLYYVK
tara:strand:- start:1102 stop:3501 length:2400 start_codon:yes stop_codon:yes gene_type:complete